MEAYLQAFERTASREEWPPAQWASLNALFLSGTAQKVYQDLAPEQAKNYNVLKKEILRRYGNTLIAQSQKFYDWNYDPAQSPRVQMHDLIRITKNWMTVEPASLSPPV